MIGWLRKRSGLPSRRESMSLQAKNTELKKSLETMKDTVKEGGMMIQKEEAKDESEEEEEDDEMEEPPDFNLKRDMNKARASVSAEAYGAWNQKKEFVPQVIPKSDEQKARLEKVLTNSFMFNQLSRKDLDVILNATQEAVFEAGATILKEGDDGD